MQEGYLVCTNKPGKFIIEMNCNCQTQILARPILLII